MEISRDGRRVPELIDTSAPGPGAEYTHTSRQRARKRGASERARETERERDVERGRSGGTSEEKRDEATEVDARCKGGVRADRFAYWCSPFWVCSYAA